MLINFSTNGLKVISLAVLVSVLYHQSFAQGTSVKNPLIPGFNEEINFKIVTAQSIKEATDKAIGNAKAALEKIYAIPDGKHTFKNTLEAFDNPDCDIVYSNGRFVRWPAQIQGN